MVDNNTADLIKKPNICQYWSIDRNGNPTEPAKCAYWDNTKSECTKSEAVYYPHCNLIGTQTKCITYSGSGQEKMCVLPDPNRSVVNRATGQPWATVSGNAVNVKAINGYNNGYCDGSGTNTTCSGYQPGIMNFGIIQPDDKSGSQHIDEGGVFTSVSGFGTRLPLNYTIYNVRAQLSTCYWWDGEPAKFTVVSGEIGEIESKCINSDEITFQYREFNWNNNLKLRRPPCNGCKPECPKYTGVCWIYCVDEKMRPGDKVLAEQILELRYYLKKDSWSLDEYNNAFLEPEIYAWEGETRYSIFNAGTPTERIFYELPVNKTQIHNFENFKIDKYSTILTEGTRDNTHLPNYPTLLRELREPICAPIIRNVFDTYTASPNSGNTTSSGNENFQKNIFETVDINHKNWTIYGESFNCNVVYVVNLADPDLSFFPKQHILAYNNMSEIESRLTNSRFKSFYDELDQAILFSLKVFPDKIITHIPTAGMFCVDTPTFFGNNQIFVFAKVNGRWEYDKIEVDKFLCGGVVGQTSFSITGTGDVDYLCDYSRNFMADSNDNGTITFSFFPFIAMSQSERSSVAYVFNDAVQRRLDTNPAFPAPHPTYDLGYYLYKTTIYENLELTIDDIKILGSGGFLLLIIPDESKLLSNAVKSWEIGGKITLEYGDGDVIELEIYKKDSTTMEVNQIIVRPKHINDFKSICAERNDIIKIDKIYNYEKRSFNEVPQNVIDTDIVLDSFLEPDYIITYRDNERLERNQNNFVLTKFGDTPLIISAVIRGLTGRIRGIIKTKLITWVRQPYCRDVEIFYEWSAGYTHTTLLPERILWGPTGVRIDPQTYYHTYIPFCGDHDLSAFTGKGPMWYPYSDCDDVARYEVNTVIESDTRVMELFLSGYPADPPHNKYDMRMLGPSNSYGYRCDIHASIWNCHSDWSYCNDTKKTDNLFIGYGRYRGGLDELAKTRALQNYGSLPKFGNTYRDFLRSYRSIDVIDYYYWNGEAYERRRKWVPSFEFYTDLDIGSLTSDSVFKTYSSNDYYNDGSIFIDQYGLLRAGSTIEGVNINEQIDYGTRYRFEDIFKAHSVTNSIYYPEPRHLMGAGIQLTPIMPWYTYRDYPNNPINESIQWAWREVWGKIERSIAAELRFNYTPRSYLGSHQILESEDNLENEATEDRHLFLDIYYPDYQYSYDLTEHRLVCDEGYHSLFVKAPTGSGVLKVNYGEQPYWSIKLDEGPPRCFDKDGSWVAGKGDCYKTLYDTCTQDPWFSNVTLFTTGYDNITPSADRTVEIYDDTGTKIDKYYQRGLDVRLQSTKFEFLPHKYLYLPDHHYQIKLNNAANTNFFNQENNFWAHIADLSQFYPATNELNLVYDIGGFIDIDFLFNEALSVNKIVITYGFGSVQDHDASELLHKWAGQLYHIPGIFVSSSNDGINFTTLHSLNQTEVSTPSTLLNFYNCVYDIDFKVENVLNPKKYLRISLNTDISTNEKVVDNNDIYNSLAISNLIYIKTIKLYYTKLIDATEHIRTYERKYYVSHGQHGDIPPHGYESTGSLLYPVSNDASTVYQSDTLYGMVGAPNSAGELTTMNKLRGRILKECHPDKEPLGGAENVYLWETLQKKIYDEIAIESGETSFQFISVVPPTYAEQLESLGLSFPSWTCVFLNTGVRPLKKVEARAPYSPAGHYWTWDFDNMHKCLLHSPVPYVDVFDYVFKSAYDDVTLAQADWIIVVTFYKGIGRVLTNALDYNGYDLTFNERVTQSLSEPSTTVIMSFPGGVDSLN